MFPHAFTGKLYVQSVAGESKWQEGGALQGEKLGDLHCVGELMDGDSESTSVVYCIGFLETIWRRLLTKSDHCLHRIKLHVAHS